LRLGTNLAYSGQLSDDEARGWIEEWAEAGVDTISDSNLAWNLFSELVAASPRALRNAVDGAHLAGIAISRGATLASFDSDFECFVEHGLRWEDLAAG
jgi:hypothetical protein